MTEALKLTKTQREALQTCVFWETRENKSGVHVDGRGAAAFWPLSAAGLVTVTETRTRRYRVLLTPVGWEQVGGKPE